MRRVLCAAVAVLACAIALSACGGGQSETSQVRAKLQQYALAFRNHDYKTICDQVLAPVLVEKFVQLNLNCETAIKQATGSVKGATFVISKQVTISGSNATVGVLTQNPKAKPQLAEFQLSKTDAGWRIAGLGNPVG